MGTLLEDLSTQSRGWSGPYQTASATAVGKLGRAGPIPQGPAQTQEKIVYQIGSGRQVGGAAAFLPVKTGGRTLQFLVDTGASVTIISSTVYRDLAADQRPTLQPDRYTHIQVADKNLMPIDGVAELQFETSGQQFKYL